MAEPAEPENGTLPADLPPVASLQHSTGNAVEQAQAWEDGLKPEVEPDDVKKVDGDKGSSSDTDGERVPLEEKWKELRGVALNYFKKKKNNYDKMTKMKKERLKELIIHVVFVVLFSYVALSARDTAEAHYLVGGLKSQITGAPVSTIWSETKDFSGVNNFGDFWVWMKDACVGDLFPSNENMTLRDSLYLGVNYFITDITLRQMRVKRQDCDTSVPPNMRDRAKNCFFPFSGSEMDDSEAPLVVVDENQTIQWPASNEKFTWYYKPRTGPATVDSVFDKDYGNGGYVLQLKSTYTQADALQALDIAEANHFFSQAYTRVIFLEYVVYNPGVNLVVACVLQFEIPATAGFTPTSSFRAVNLYRVGRSSSLSGLILEIIVFFLVLVMLALEMMKIEKTRPRKAYFKNGYNLMTLLNLIIFIVVMVMEVATIFQAASAMSLEGQDWFNYDIHRLVFWTFQVYNWNAFNALLTWLKTLKYVDIVNKKTTQLVETLSNASTSILVLMLLFCILYCGYGIAFFMAFGQDVEDFRSLGASIVALFRAMLGDFDFATLRKANLILGPILFISYIILIFFCLLNMFMAVIMNSYDEVCEDLEKKAASQKEQDKDIALSIRKTLKRSIMKIFRRKKKAKKPKKDVLTKEELNTIYELEKVPFQRSGIMSSAQLIKVADTDLDGTVSFKELKACMHDSDSESSKSGSEEEIPVEVHLQNLFAEQKNQRKLILQIAQKIQKLTDQ